MKIKLITLNVCKQINIQDKAIDFINKENPDVVLLQEMYNGEDPKLELRYRTLKEFRNNLKLPYWKFAKNFRDITSKDHVDAEQGNAILSRFSIVDFKNMHFDIQYTTLYDYEDQGNYSQLPQNMLYAKLDLERVFLNVYSVHGPWDLDGKRDSKRRLRMSEMIVKEIKNKQNVIIAGDFNVRPETKTIYNIEKYLKNVFKDELETTFNMKRKDNPGYSTAVVDMIFVSQNIKVVDHYCPQVDISDHLPLVAVLEI